MSGRRQTIRVAIILAALALPLAASLVSSYWLARSSALRDLGQLANASAVRAARIFDEGRRKLEEMERQLQGDCGAPDIDVLRRAGFESLYFREAGLVRRGTLLCTSFETFAVPLNLPSDYLRRRPIFSDGNFDVLEPQPTVLGGRSMVLLRFSDRSRFDYNNLLLNLDQFSEIVEYFQSIEGAIYIVDPQRPAPLQIAGTAPARFDPRVPGQHVTADGSLVVIAHARPYPIASIVSLSGSELLQRWQTQAQPAALFGFAITTLVLLLLRRWLPAGNDIADELRRAIRHGELELHFQPVIDGYTQRVLSAESLLRWRHPARGLLLPDYFLPAAERAQLMGELTSYVLRMVRDAITTLPAPLRIAVNVPPAMLRDGSLTRAVNACFGEQAPLDRLTLEITERELIEFADSQAVDHVEALAARGAKISLDDFGTGFSGLSHLRHLRPQQIKIDRSFIRALGSEAVTAALVDAVVAMTDTLGVELVAEGVETEAQRELLLLRGIHAMQGWLYAKAMPLDNLRAFIELRNAGQPSEPSQLTRDSRLSR